MEKKRVLIVVNKAKNHALALCKVINQYLNDNNYIAESILTLGKENLGPYKVKSYFLIISIGGDGTVLGVAREFLDIPILALNAGSIGFITETPMEEWQIAFEEFCCGDASISERMRCEVSVVRGDEIVFKERGLNDIVVSSKGISRLVDLSIQVDDKAIARFRADGVVIATPTGSTAYSAAAGGPVLLPEMEAFIVNPICPFSLSSRAIVLNSDKIISIYVEKEQRTSLSLTVDGQVLFNLKPNDKINIKKIENKCKIVQSRERNFFQVLREKLGWLGGPND